MALEFRRHAPRAVNTAGADRRQAIVERGIAGSKFEADDMDLGAFPLDRDLDPETKAMPHSSAASRAAGRPAMSS